MPQANSKKPQMPADVSPLSLNRPVNWLEQTAQSLTAQMPEISECSFYVSERLAALLLERLPSELSTQVLELLPNAEAEECNSLQSSARSDSDSSIGYADFIDRATYAIGCCKHRAAYPKPIEQMGQQAADAFLWSVVQEIPSELKSRLIEALPTELRSRMNLYNANSDSARVA